MAPFKIARPRFLAYFAFEMGLILAVIVGLAYLTWSLTPRQPETIPTLPVLLIGVAFCLVLFSTQGVNLGDDGSMRRQVIVFSIISVITGLIGCAGIWLLFGGPERRLPGLLLLEGGVAVPVAVALWRWFSSHFNLLNLMRENVLILGTGETARDVCRWIVSGHSSEYAVVGFADENEDLAGTVLAMGVRIQTDYQSLPSFCPSRVDRVIVALDEKRGRLPVHQLMELRLRGIDIEEATTYFERISGKIAVETMLPSWLIFSEGFTTTRLGQIVKRVADILLSLALLVFAIPIGLIAAAMIRLDSRGPVLYRQERMGRDRRPFQLLKFRSMKIGAEEESGPAWSMRFDPRVTRVGRLIRLLRIDELPQLINVLRGEMSFVGPRPERPHFVRQLEQSIPYYGLRMVARPGITGWAQVKYGYAASEDDAKEKLKYDLFYLKNSNLMLDLWIVLKTVSVVLLGTGAR